MRAALRVSILWHSSAEQTRREMSGKQGLLC